MRLFFFLVLAALLLCQCAGHNPDSPPPNRIASIDDKMASLAARQSAWKGSSSVQVHGRARSQQIIDVDALQLSAEGMSYEGSTGLASLITKDGYALTATHVASLARNVGTLEGGESSKRLHLVSAVRKNQRGLHEVENLTLALYGKRIEIPRSFSQIRSGPVRLVHKFPGRDLAIVKFPRSNAPYFARTTPNKAANSGVFSSGSGISASPSASAGRIRGAIGPKKLLISMPVSPGDSGGPVFDERGRLLGVLSEAMSNGDRRSFGGRDIQLSTIELPDWAAVDKIIAADRRR